MYNKGMKMVRQNKRRGFTIIEVMLVLALTGLLFVGLIAGFGGSLARQRYKDTTQDLASNLRRLYSLVADTQVQIRDNSSACYGLKDASGSVMEGRANANRGRSDCVVYGVAASIYKDRIETTQILGKDIKAISTEIDTTSLTDLELLMAADANNLVAMKDKNGANCKIKLAGDMDNYTLKWGAKLKTTGGITHKDEDVKATILIFRSPRNGGIRTYVWKDVVHDYSHNPLSYAEFAKGNYNCSSSTGMLNSYGINSYLNNFAEEELKFCIEAGDGMVYGNNRRMIRIKKGGHSSSAVELVDADSENAEDRCL